MYTKLFGCQKQAENSLVKQERGNPEGSYTVCIMKDDTIIIGHVLLEKSDVFYQTWWSCDLLGHQSTKHGKSFGIPCIYCYTGKGKLKTTETATYS